MNSREVTSDLMEQAADYIVEHGPVRSMIRDVYMNTRPSHENRMYDRRSPMFAKYLKEVRGYSSVVTVNDWVAEHTQEELVTEMRGCAAWVRGEV